MSWRQNGQCTSAFCGSVFHLFLQKGHSTRTFSPTANCLRLKTKITLPKTMAVMPKMSRKIGLKDIPTIVSISSVQRRFQKKENSLVEVVFGQTFQNATVIAEIPSRKRIMLRAYPNLLFLSTFFILVPNPGWKLAHILGL